MRTVNGLVLAIVLAFGVPAVVDAQAQPQDSRQAPIERRDDRGNWGWLGLLGRERHTYTEPGVSRGTSTSR